VGAFTQSGERGRMHVVAPGLQQRFYLPPAPTSVPSRVNEHERGPIGGLRLRLGRARDGRGSQDRADRRCPEGVATRRCGTGSLPNSSSSSYDSRPLDGAGSRGPAASAKPSQLSPRYASRQRH
jgi:hypothetical protein